MKVTQVAQTNAGDHESSTFWIGVASRIHWSSYSHLVPNDHWYLVLFGDVVWDYQLVVVVVAVATVAWMMILYWWMSILVVVGRL